MNGRPAEPPRNAEIIVHPIWLAKSGLQRINAYAHFRGYTLKPRRTRRWYLFAMEPATDIVKFVQQPRRGNAD